MQQQQQQVEKSSSDTTIASSLNSGLLKKDQASKPRHIVFLHRKFRKRSEDRYIVDLAMALKAGGHKITIFTSEKINEKDCLEETKPLSGELSISYSGWWLPKTFWLLKALVMAFRLIFLPPCNPRPDLIILDVHSIACFLLSQFTSYKVVYLSHFYELKNAYLSSNKITKIHKDLLSTYGLKFSHQVIVLNKSLGEIFRRSFPKVNAELTYISPCVETILWREGKVDLQRIIPDLNVKKSLIFVAFGLYEKNANFELAIKSFENLLLLLDNDVKERLHLIIAGNLGLNEHYYYDDLKNDCKEKFYASQITFLKETPVIHKKTLVEECVAVLHTANCELFPETILIAMRMGRPVISTNKGFAKEALIHRISGILIEGEPHNFASAMYKVIANPTIQMFISDMAKDVYKRQYSYDVMCRRINEFVEKVAQKQKKQTKREKSFFKVK